MFTYTFAQIVLAVYAIFLAVGGAIGYYRVGSRASLIAGVASAILCVAALLYSLLVNPLHGLWAATTIALGLMFFFNYRFVAFSLRFMPAGMLAIVSLVVFTSLLITVI
ncbi:TMEM14 family protein [Paludisphaera sp.]|uniref:TMEM14 family protein n=1 Tax=Paludisphaera sp. TaxID=2017432 RepID=UPI00301D2539